MKSSLGGRSQIPKLRTRERLKAVCIAAAGFFELLFEFLLGIPLHNGSRKGATPQLSTMISQMRLLCRHRLVPTALPGQLQYAPIVYRRSHTTTIPAKAIVTPTRALWRLPTLTVPSLSTARHRNASYEAGENDSGHINTRPNEGIFFFDSESESRRLDRSLIYPRHFPTQAAMALRHTSPQPGPITACSPKTLQQPYPCRCRSDEHYQASFAG
jgi:hypothetical protein